ncbi:MAG: PDZ domain-containing protein [Geodermatophilaceae bacterium]|nr:PDZ domain-containing protein [Geodermatophilaceae bacterium]
MASSGSYLRFPSIRGDAVAFVAEDDIWLGGTDAGRAWRLTADRAPVADTRLSPAGDQVAYTSRRDGAPEVHVVDTGGGPPRRLTHWGSDFTRVLGWTDDDRVIAASAVGEPFRSRTWAYAVPLSAGPAERLAYGPVNAVAAGPGGAVVVGQHGNRRGAASWKRYRGGTAGQLWIDPSGHGTFERLQADLDGQLEDPGWVGERVVFGSDHEGYGNIYSCLADGSDLRRHTDHGDFYARAAHSDGRRVVYQCVGELWVIDELTAASQPRRLELELGGSGTALSRHPLVAAAHVEAFRPDTTARASAIEVRGSVHWVAHRDGPARQLAGSPGVRHRLPRVLAGVSAPGTDAPAVRVVLVSDADGDDALEIVTVDGTEQTRRIAGGELGRVLDLAASSDGRLVAAASHDGRVLLVDVESGRVREVDASRDGDASGLAFSPDSRWLAWSHPGPEPLRQIRLADVGADVGADGDAGGADLSAARGITMIEATPLRFTDTEPVFTLDGKHLAFLSVRTFDPVYDAFVFDLSFLAGTRPYLLPLAQRTPSPFDPSPQGRPMSVDDGGGRGNGAEGGSKGPDAGRDAAADPPPVIVDAEGIGARLVAVPVPAGNYSSLRAGHGGLLWLLDPLVGVLGDGLPRPGDKPRSAVQRYDLAALRLSVLDDNADAIEVSGDGRWLLVRDGEALRVVPADHKVPDGEEGAAERVEVDLDRIRVEIEPMAEWRQMYAEAGRLMRDHFWIADMGGVDWDAVLERYRPVLARVGTRDDLSELLWEVQGELGASHAYETPPERAVDKSRRLGLLGADLVPDSDGAWRVARVVPGESSAPAARSPLSAPGVAVQSGDAILAVGGRPVDPVAGPGALLVGAAEIPVELTIAPADSSERRHVVVVPLATEMPLRYQDWVTGRRAAVHAASGGRAGYLHIPDMVANGWAQLHRDLRVELKRECLVVDVRDNNGGHVSSLVLEKLARTVQGWATVRHMRQSPYPEDAPLGPLVAVTNEQAGSDGDIVTAMIRQLGLGPVLGTRTWGGVIGIDGRYSLVDGTQVTQPRYSFWFAGAGWGVENYGVDPDVEVQFPPQAWAAGSDPQLDAAVTLVLERVASAPAATPPDTSDRPDRSAPPLPPRP